MMGHSKFCFHCGERIPFESSFCEYCGKQLQISSDDSEEDDLIDDIVKEEE